MFNKQKSNDNIIIYDDYLSNLLTLSKKERREQLRQDQFILHRQRLNQEHANTEWVKKLRNHPHKKVLIISDIHAPYQHEDTLDFLEALNKKMKPDLVVNLGDELDYHAMSFHESDADLNSAGHELLCARRIMSELETIFPEMYITTSNHGSMKYRKAKAHGIPRHLIVSYGDALFSQRKENGSLYRVNNKGEKWYWSNKIEFLTSQNQTVMCVHNKTKNVINNILLNQMNFVQGHYHSKTTIEYVSTPHNLFWGMQVGCLVDDESVAFEYNKVDNYRPILTCGAVIDGFPTVIPMLLEKGGRWCGKIVGI